jgi:hypothetical protein
VFKQKINSTKMELTKKEKQEWEDWLNTLPENVKTVAEVIVPWKRYWLKDHDTDSTYSPVSYGVEKESGNVVLTCSKYNERFPVLAGYNVFGMDPKELIEVIT